MMTIAYFSNFLNHHQKSVADELASTEGIEYTFVETVPMYDWLKKGGYSDYSNESYVLRAWENTENKQKAVELAKTVDVALFAGPDVLYLEIIRARCCDKLSFEVSERWLKKGWINILSPRLLKSIWNYHVLFKKKNFYKLCASAFCANDQYKLLSFRNRCYKWGYFTKIDTNLDVESYLVNRPISKAVSIMWCSRFLKLKHPELPILMAKKLKDKGFCFILNMYGSGIKLEVAKKLVRKLDIEDVVSFKGTMPNDEILRAMRQHEIFLFTSDQNEGWGAVANEAMSNGCVLIASNQIGSVPFLVKDGETGLSFKSAGKNYGFVGGDSLKIDEIALNSLTDRVEMLLINPLQRKRIAINGYRRIRDIWSPKNAAKNLLILIKDFQEGRETSINEGPCSKAYPVNIC